jgi:aerobic-type carbon monoxide dehydrogenase small subunit (CoxS/CutS family)
MSNKSVTLQVNGKPHTLEVPSEQTLLETLREGLDLVGARESCGIGMCGTCTVLVDNLAISSCLMLTAQVEGKHITTIEGLSPDGQLHPVQQAYIDHGAFQCAYCTPGLILSTVALLNEHVNPDEAAIREYLAGNLCRCGSYVNILNAVRACHTIDD